MALRARMARKWNAWFIRPWFPFAAVLAVSFVLVTGLSLVIWGFSGYPEHFDKILSHMNGTLFDIIVLGVVVSVISAAQEKRKLVTQWEEEIDDYRGWNAPEATFRIAGAVRRLSRENVHPIDLTSCYLRGANLSGLDLSNSIFDGADMLGVILKGSILRNASFAACKLSNADLRNCDLRGTGLTKADLASDDIAGAILDS